MYWVVITIVLPLIRLMYDEFVNFLDKRNWGIIEKEFVGIRCKSVKFCVIE